METISSTIRSLALSIEAEGFGDDSLELLVMAHAARDLGVNETLVQVMIDEVEPEIARERAFAMVARLMASLSDLDSVVVDRTERTLAVAC
jgi:hypothetical protein